MKKLYRTKVFLVILMTVVLVFSLGLSACGNTNNDNTTSARVSGFDETTNLTLSFGGIDFSFPSYFDALTDDSTDTEKSYYPEGEGTSAGLGFMSEDFSITQEDFLGAKTDMIDGLYDSIKEDYGEADILMPEDVTIAGLPGWKVDFSIEADEEASEGSYACIFNPNVKKVIVLYCVFDNLDKSNNDYLGDFEKMLETAVLSQATSGNDSGDSTSYTQFLKEYEAFVDDYVALYQKYMDDPTDLSLLTEFTEMAEKATEWAEKSSEIEGDLSGADLEEYLEVTARITKKLLGIIG